MSTNGKPKFAMYWAAACGGCEIAVLNIHEVILDVDANFEVVFWPVAMDAKYKDLEAMPDKSITLTLFNGGIRNDENAHIAQVLRHKSQILVAFGACATQGGIPGLANLGPVHEIVDTAYTTISTDNPTDLRPQTRYRVPEGELTIPTLYPTLKALDQVVPVDYYMPGCPPEAEQIAAVVGLVIQALKGEAQLPPAGAVIGASHSTVCDECKRTRDQKTITHFTRMATFQPHTDQCLLEQGILCAGMATRGGCEARCPSANMPCVGCYGPAPDVVDQGARMLSAIASVVDSKDPVQVEKIMDEIVDPVGTFYRFGLPRSLLHASKAAQGQ